MLFKHEVLTGIAEGRVTCAFRRWRRPSVRGGTELRTPAGLVRIESVEQIDPAAIDDDARRAGFPGAASVLHDLRGRAADPLYRIRLSFVGVPIRGSSFVNGPTSTTTNSTRSAGVWHGSTRPADGVRGRLLS